MLIVILDQAFWKEESALLQKKENETDKKTKNIEVR
tara:strand:+ start:4716 stop:4823 length:108 start_codon:yes stop_codon:yes gene_type:complete